MSFGSHPSPPFAHFPLSRAKKGPITSCVVDAEVVAYDRDRHCLLPFQILSTRKRKVDENDTEEQKVQVILQAFDLIFLNGKSLLREPLHLRRTLLHNSFNHLEGYFHFASGFDHEENGDTTAIEIFMQEACQASCEGLMVKTLNENASYEPSKRSLNWLKLKKDYINGMGVCDSVDLVVIGGYYGRGKRTNVYGAYLMACYDPVHDEYQSVCKVGTGFKDEDLIRLTEQMKRHILGGAGTATAPAAGGSEGNTGTSSSSSSSGGGSNRKPSNYNVGDPLTPDDWFDNAVVWELQAADLSKSSVHKGGIDRLGDTGRGIGLRFPRYLRDRPDKKPEMATTSEQIVEMYQSQGDMMEGGAGGGGDEDDDDDIL
jgi:DNA ligase 1